MKQTRKEIKRLEAVVRPLDALRRQADDARELVALGEKDPDFMDSVTQEILSLGAKVSSWLEDLRRGPHDDRPALLTIKAGAGGDEACLWAEMLVRMYSQYANQKGLETVLLDAQYNKPDGFKFISMKIDGPRAYGLFKSEAGIHRLSRISPLGHSERHTSFCSVDVFPETEADPSFKVPPEDVEVSFCCGSGPGGQKINKTAVVARVKHIPTGVMVRCQAGRSQPQNRAIAMVILESKLRAMEEARRAEKADEARKTKRGIAFGNRDRTYVLTQHPLVHDHRTGKKTKLVDDVLAGNLDLIRE